MKKPSFSFALFFLIFVLTALAAFFLGVYFLNLYTQFSS
jgi:hypothetical protein